MKTISCLIAVVLLPFYVFSFNVLFVENANSSSTDLEITMGSLEKEKCFDIAKKALLKENFLLSDTMKDSFTAKRTTNSDSDYYIALVSYTKNKESVLTISFKRVGTGLLNFKKLSSRIEQNIKSETESN